MKEKIPDWTIGRCKDCEHLQNSGYCDETGDYVGGLASCEIPDCCPLEDA
jgi:hypothetical protein